MPEERVLRAPTHLPHSPGQDGHGKPLEMDVLMQDGWRCIYRKYATASEPDPAEYGRHVPMLALLLTRGLVRRRLAQMHLSTLGLGQADDRPNALHHEEHCERPCVELPSRTLLGNQGCVALCQVGRSATRTSTMAQSSAKLPPHGAHPLEGGVGASHQLRLPTGAQCTRWGGGDLGPPGAVLPTALGGCGNEHLLC